jgi:hypothetical protein
MTVEHVVAGVLGPVRVINYDGKRLVHVIDLSRLGRVVDTWVAVPLS